MTLEVLLLHESMYCLLFLRYTRSYRSITEYDVKKVTVNGKELDCS